MVKTKTILHLFLILLPFLSFSQDNVQNPALLKKYAGTYRMGIDGVKMSPESDKYVLTADGKGTWTIFTTTNPDGSVSKVPLKTKGTWKASEGLIQIFFSTGDLGEGGDMLTDYKWDGKVFRNGNIFLKKEVAKVKGK